MLQGYGPIIVEGAWLTLTLALCSMALAILLGLVQAFGQHYFPSWIEVATYLVLIGVLLVRPQGLFSVAPARKA